MKTSTEPAASASGASTLTTGVSVQVQTLDRTSLRPAVIGADLVGAIEDGIYRELIRPLAKRAAIEIVSPRFATIGELRQNMQAIRGYLTTLAGAFGIVVAGGGCHPLSAGSSTAAGQLFSLHLRIGCPDGVLADYLCAAWQRYLPQLIALSAASPFHAGGDTECASYRARTLEELDPDQHARVCRDAADGIEIRVCDAPLNLDTAVDLAAYAQTLSAYLLAEVPAADDAAIFEPRLARLQAARFGLDGLLGTHDDGQTIGQDILSTIERLRLAAYPPENGRAFDRIEEQVLACGNDATTMRSYLRSDRAMTTMLAHLAQTWASARHDNRIG